MESRQLYTCRGVLPKVKPQKETQTHFKHSMRVNVGTHSVASILKAVYNWTSQSQRVILYTAIV